MEKIKSFKQLKIWQKGIEIVLAIYKITRRFPREEMYGLTSQMRMASLSVPSNIAEGFKQFHRKEYRQFLHIALGSLAELETQLIIAKELGFIRKEIMDEISEQLDHESKMIASLLKKLG